MGADVDVRIAGAADLEALVRLASLFRDHLGRSTPLNADLRTSIATLLQDPGTAFFLAGSGPATCGYVQCRYRYSEMDRDGSAATVPRDALRGMQSPDHWRQTVEAIFGMWLHGSSDPRLTGFVRNEMGAYGFDMWSRAAREISAAYTAAGSPLRSLAGRQPPVPVLHLCSQPDDPGVLAPQQAFATSHPWFDVQVLKTHTHFPMFEGPDEMAAAIEQFVGKSSP